MKDDPWMIACAYTEFYFTIAMEKLKLKLKSTYDYVLGIKKEIWTKYIFNPRSKVDLVVSNFHVI